MDINKEREAFEAYMAEKYKNLVDRRQCLNNGGGYMAWDMNVAWQVWQAKAQAVPEIDELKAQLSTEKSLRSMCEHLINTKQDEIIELKAEVALEWIDFELEKPMDGQKCLVIFESKDCEDAQRWMCIDEFNEGMFDFIANWEDQCASVALPAGSIISKVRAVCWATTNLSNAPLSFDQFYEAQEPAND